MYSIQFHKSRHRGDSHKNRYNNKFKIQYLNINDSKKHLKNDPSFFLKTHFLAQMLSSWTDL